MSRTIVKRSWTNPVTGTRHMRYEKSLLGQMGDAFAVGIIPTILAVLGFVTLMDKLTEGHDENYEAYCARRDAMPKKSAKVELTILGIAVVIFIVLMWYAIATA